MTLGILWYLIDLVFWMGFFILEGFDLGVGALHHVISKNDTERRVCINTIGPVWDGNEVWLIVAGAVIFAAFPLWYATMFSTFYLALVVVLLALIVRGVSFEYTRKVDHEGWQASFRWGLTISSALIPLLIGVALGDLLHGLPIDKQHQFTGNFFTLLTPFGLVSGLTMLSLSLVMGANYLTLKTTGELRKRAADYAVRLGWASIVLVWGFVTWAHLGLGRGFVPNPFEVLAVLAVVAATWLAHERQEGWAFTAAAVAVASTVATFFVELYPHVMISTTKASYSLTVGNTASPPYTLKVMTVVAVIFFPVVLVYQAWTYVAFKRRISSSRLDAGKEQVQVDSTPNGSQGQ